MDYKEYLPSPALSHLIECYWTNTLHPEDFQQDHDYIIPDGSTDAIFMLKGNYLRDDEYKNKRHLVEYCSLVPAFHKAVKVYQKPHTTCLVIRFKPGAVQQLTGVSLGELDQPAYPLQSLIPELAEVAMNEIIKKSTVKVILSTIDNWFLRLNSIDNQSPLVSSFITSAIQNKGKIVIKDFCHSFRMHKSTLEKTFKHATGLTPKQYATLIRFNYLLNQMLFSATNLTETSLEMGYFDQSHMIKDFKKIIGISPRDFLEKKFTVPKLAALSISNKSDHFKTG